VTVDTFPGRKDALIALFVFLFLECEAKLFVCKVCRLLHGIEHEERGEERCFGRNHLGLTARPLLGLDLDPEEIEVILRITGQELVIGQTSESLEF